MGTAHLALLNQRVSGTARALEIAFLTRLGHALSAAGDPVSSTERTLRGIAQRNGLSDVQIGVLPTLVLVRGHDSPLPMMDLATADVGHDLRLDQIGALYDIVHSAQLGQLSAGDGLARLSDVWTMQPRFGAPLRIMGQVVLSVGLGLILTPNANALAYCAVLGLIVGLLIELALRWPTLEVLLPAVASLLVAVIVFVAASADLVSGPLLLLIPPLITFLPGGMLTTAIVELADHHSIAGASRLLAGATQVLLLVFGIVAAQALVGLPPEMAYARRADISFGAWAPWLGSLLFAIGVYYHFVGPRRSLVWLCLIVYVASLGEFLGNMLLSGSFGGFVGALTMTVAAFWLDRLPAAPPFQVLFLPAFWLLVPGVLAVVGLADLVGNPASVALVDLGQVAVTIVSIALGVLVGVALTRALPWSDLG
jgi:uncharacterized membrane protein YjjP (DUF1212 family)